MVMEIREGSLKKIKRDHWEGDSVITYAVVEVEREYSKKSEKNMTAAEADALKMLSKTTEAEEVPMVKYMREGDLKTREVALGGDIVITYALEEVPKVN